MARYYGGKNHVFQSIINLIPRHLRFIEAFAGSAAVSRHLARSPEAVAIELDRAQAQKLRLELPGHRVLCCDAIAYIERYAEAWGPETVVFVDPPYPIADRRDARARYRCELDDAQHERLIAVLRRLRARVIVCGQPWGLYARAFADWQTHELAVVLRSGRPGVERLWTNYADPYPLHDYRYFGDDKQRRQDLRRRIGRQLDIFGAMNPHHRAAVLRALVGRYGVPGADPAGIAACGDVVRSWQASAPAGAGAADAGVDACGRGELPTQAAAPALQLRARQAAAPTTPANGLAKKGPPKRGAIQR